MSRARSLTFAVLPPALLAAAIGLSIPAIMLLVRFAGFRIPQANIEQDYLFGLVWALILGLTIALWPIPLRDKRNLAVLWLIRCGVTLGFMLVYEWYYGLDAFFYFRESTRGPIPLEPAGWGFGTQNMMVIAWVHSYLLPDSYHAMKVTFAMVGLIGIYLIYRAGVKVMGREDPRILMLLGLFPSVLFWSSILGKEPLQLLGVALYVYGGVGFWKERNPLYLVVLTLGIALSTFMRAWYGLIMIVPMAVFALFGVRGRMARIAMLLVTLVGLGWATQRFADRMKLDAIGDLAAAAGTVAGGFEGDEYGYQVTEFTGLGSMLRFAPKGAFAALFRPLPGDVMNPFGLMAGAENLVLLSLLILGILRLDRERIRDPLVLWSASLILIWAGIHGFVSYFNYGAAVRFRLPILPVLIGLVLYLSARGHQPTDAGADSVGG